MQKTLTIMADTEFKRQIKIRAAELEVSVRVYLTRLVEKDFAESREAKDTKKE